MNTNTCNVTQKSFKCDECGYICKRENSPAKPTNTKHQLYSAKANLKIRQFKEEVEHLTLGKYRVELTVCRLKDRK